MAKGLYLLNGDLFQLEDGIDVAVLANLFVG